MGMAGGVTATLAISGEDMSAPVRRLHIHFRRLRFCRQRSDSKLTTPSSSFSLPLPLFSWKTRPRRVMLPCPPPQPIRIRVSDSQSKQKIFRFFSENLFYLFIFPGKDFIIPEGFTRSRGTKKAAYGAFLAGDNENLPDDRKR